MLIMATSLHILWTTSQK